MDMLGRGHPGGGEPRSRDFSHLEGIIAEKGITFWTGGLEDST